MNKNFDSANIFDQIRSASKQVAELAQHVQIDYDKLDTYTERLSIKDIKNPPLDTSVHYLNKGNDTLAFFLTLETINFGSGYFPFLENPDEQSGYFSIAGALNDYYLKNGSLSALELTQISGLDCTSIFNQSLENKIIQELMQLFAKSLNELGHFLLKNFDGSFELLFELVDHSAQKLIELLLQIPCFYDISNYDGLNVPILKRAQICAADIALAFNNTGLGYFKDLDQLTIFADNMVPHVLRCDGILNYTETLASLVDQQKLIPAGSTEEIEIRACAIHAVELLKAQFQKQGHQFTSVDLDYLLWNRGIASSFENKYPIHLTRTIFY